LGLPITGAEKMRRLLVLGILIVLTGCQNVAGPFRPKSPQRVDDPSVSIKEQQRRERARFALPDEAATMPYSGPSMPVQGTTTPR
jgi:hypothetical protein